MDKIKKKSTNNLFRADLPTSLYFCHLKDEVSFFPLRLFKR